MVKIEKVTPVLLEKLKNSKYADEFVQDICRLWQTYGRSGYAISVVEDKEVRGFCLLESGKKEEFTLEVGLVQTAELFTIRGMWVAEPFQKLGLGSQIIRETLSKVLADASNPDKTLCLVNISAGAEEFYTKMGFTIAGVRKDLGEEAVAVGYVAFDDGHPMFWAPVISQHFHENLGMFTSIVRV